MDIKASSINSNEISQLNTHCVHIQYSNIVKYLRQLLRGLNVVTFQIDVIKKSLMNTG